MVSEFLNKQEIPEMEIYTGCPKMYLKSNNLQTVSDIQKILKTGLCMVSGVFLL